MNSTIDIQKTLNRLEKLLKSYISVVDTSIIEHTTYIVEVGFLTVSTDEKGLMIVENKEFPTLFSRTAVEKITSFSFYNGEGEVITPTIYGRNDWYNQKINEIKSILLNLKSISI